MFKTIKEFLFGKSNPWIDLSKQEPPKDCGIIWGKFTDDNPIGVPTLSGKMDYSKYGLVIRLSDGRWIHGWQRADLPYVYINVTHWKLKLNA